MPQHRDQDHGSNLQDQDQNQNQDTRFQDQEETKRVKTLYCFETRQCLNTSNFSEQASSIEFDWFLAESADPSLTGKKPEKTSNDSNDNMSWALLLASLQFFSELRVGTSEFCAKKLQILHVWFANSACHFCEFCATFQPVFFLWYNCLWHRCTIQSIVACWST